MFFYHIYLVTETLQMGSVEAEPAVTTTLLMRMSFVSSLVLLEVSSSYSLREFFRDETELNCSLKLWYEIVGLFKLVGCHHHLYDSLWNYSLHNHNIFADIK